MLSLPFLPSTTTKPSNQICETHTHINAVRQQTHPCQGPRTPGIPPARTPSPSPRPTPSGTPLALPRRRQQWTGRPPSEADPRGPATPWATRQSEGGGKKCTERHTVNSIVRGESGRWRVTCCMAYQRVDSYSGRRRQHTVGTRVMFNVYLEMPSGVQRKSVRFSVKNTRIGGGWGCLACWWTHVGKGPSRKRGGAGVQRPANEEGKGKAGRRRVRVAQQSCGKMGREKRESTCCCRSQGWVCILLKERKGRKTQRGWPKRDARGLHKHVQLPHGVSHGSRRMQMGLSFYAQKQRSVILKAVRFARVWKKAFQVQPTPVSSPSLSFSLSLPFCVP